MASTGPGGRLRKLPLELGIVALAVAVNLLVRWYTLDRTDEAVTHAYDVLALEQRLQLDLEHQVQDATLAVPGLGEFLTHFYFLGYLPTLGAVMVWIYLRDRATYRSLRNALLAAGAVGMLV